MGKSRQISVGLDVGTYTTRVVACELATGGIYPKILGTGSSETKGVRHGYVTNISEASKSILKAIQEVEKNSGVKIKKAIIAIGGISLSSEISYGSAVISKSDGEVTYLDVNKALVDSESNLQIINKKILHSIPVSYRLDAKDIHGRPEGMKGIKLEVKTLHITCLEQHMEDLITATSQAGIEVADVVATPLAISTVALTDRQKIAGCVLVDIGAETVSIAVFENGATVSLHVFSIGSTDITNDIALGLKIPLEEAEGLKIGVQTQNGYSRKKLDQIIEARLKDVFELIDSHLRRIRRSGLLPAGVIITGGGSNIVMIEEISREVLKLPTKVLTIDLMPMYKNKVKNSSWLVPIGLCATSSGENSIESATSGISLRRAYYGIKNTLQNIGKQLLP